jgi:trans-feruloyl-CoA hydratase/vanillin synthase
MSENDDKSVVKYEVKDGVAWVYFNRPDKRNAMSPTLNRRMLEVIDELEYDDNVGVLVLTGEGTAWQAGMDLKEYFRESEAKGLGGTRKAQREAYTWWRRLRWYQKPTIAMVNGWCFGGAFGPLYACDLAICSDDAYFGLSEINWGILPGGGATKVAIDLMSMRDAMYLTLTGDKIDGKTAAAMKLVNESVPADQLKPRVEELCASLLEKAPAVVKAAKDAVRRVKEMTYDNAEDFLIRAQEAANYFDNESRKEGIKQFIDDKTYKPGLGAFDKDKTQ